jgi:hypothetical protein
MSIRQQRCDVVLMVIGALCGESYDSYVAAVARAGRRGVVDTPPGMLDRVTALIGRLNRCLLSAGEGRRSS